MNTIEAMARGMCAEDGFDLDEMTANDAVRWIRYVPGATAAIAALAKNVSDEMVEAALVAYASGSQASTSKAFRLAMRAALVAALEIAASKGHE